MQAAYYSYAMFLALLLLIVAVVLVVAGARALIRFIRGPRHKNIEDSKGGSS